jgi:hypothetical protein
MMRRDYLIDAEGFKMYSTIVAYVIAFLGVVMIGSGLWGLLYLQGAPRPTPMRYYAMMIGMICGGFAMGGLAQGLRLLVAIARQIQNTH